MAGITLQATSAELYRSDFTQTNETFLDTVIESTSLAFSRGSKGASQSIMDLSSGNITVEVFDNTGASFLEIAGRGNGPGKAGIFLGGAGDTIALFSALGLEYTAGASSVDNDYVGDTEGFTVNVGTDKFGGVGGSIEWHISGRHRNNPKLSMGGFFQADYVGSRGTLGWRVDFVVAD